jgi:hypothetical protein
VSIVVVTASQKQQCYCSECRRAETRSGADNPACKPPDDQDKEDAAQEVHRGYSS